MTPPQRSASTKAKKRRKAWIMFPKGRAEYLQDLQAQKSQVHYCTPLHKMKNIMLIPVVIATSLMIPVSSSIEDETPFCLRALDRMVSQMELAGRTRDACSIA